MSDGSFPDRLSQLRNRWEADPSSRIFLQLAEEYRHQGRVKEALDVLDRGLKEHPGYLSALVAKGRCHLELGEPEPARSVLERVVKQDATQMVANKLLVRAYLDTGEPERARDRLDLYSLLNDSDPEIDELRRRLRAMEQPPQAEKPGSFPTPDGPFLEAAPALPRREPAPAPPAPRASDVFDLGAPPVGRRGDVFDLTLPAARAAAPVRKDEPFTDLLAPPVAAPAPSPAAAVAEAAPEPEEEPEPADVLFPGLGTRDSRRRYLENLAAEGLFLLDLTAEAPATATVSVPVEDLLARPHAVAPQPPPLETATTVRRDAPVDVEEPFGYVTGGASPGAVIEEPTIDMPVVEAPAPCAPEPAAAAAGAEPVATATLGELYLRQGHLGEAERIFHEVLRREPDSAAAREALARLAVLRQERPPLAARELLAGYEPGPNGGEVEMKARKAWVLNGYLKRLRRGSQRDVS